jgi:hypothetical protein
LRLWAESTCSTARGGFPQPVGPTTARIPHHARSGSSAPPPCSRRSEPQHRAGSRLGHRSLHVPHSRMIICWMTRIEWAMLGVQGGSV